jgi:hypothetical protein
MLARRHLVAPPASFGDLAGGRRRLSSLGSSHSGRGEEAVEDHRAGAQHAASPDAAMSTATWSATARTSIWLATVRFRSARRAGRRGRAARQVPSQRNRSVGRIASCASWAFCHRLRPAGSPANSGRHSLGDQPAGAADRPPELDAVGAQVMRPTVSPPCRRPRRGAVPCTRVRGAKPSLRGPPLRGRVVRQGLRRTVLR